MTLPLNNMLTEDHIVSLLGEHLKSKGYKISQSAKTTDKGIDIIARSGSHILHVEAKGATSSKSHTNRYGKPFTANQINSHVSRAILTAMILLNHEPQDLEIKVAIALPDNQGHRKLIGKILNSLRTLDIKVYWVSQQEVIEE